MSSLSCRNKYLVLALKKVCKNRYKSFPHLPHFALFFTFSQNIFHRIVAFLHKLSKWQDIKTRGTPYFFLEKNHSEKRYRECHFDPVLLARLAQKSLKQLSLISFFNFLITTLRTDFFKFIIPLFFTTGTITFSIDRV